MSIRILASALLVALLLRTSVAVAASPLAAAAEWCFPETGLCVGGLFYQYWLDNGGLRQQGLPISPEFDEVNPTNGQVYRTQYFERARFEHHPEYRGTPYEVLLGLLGREQFLAKYPDGAPSLGSGGGRCFENGLCVRGRFADYWEQHGGLRQQGLPISPEFPEISPTNGQEYRVQYFERGRFEYHPENDTPYDVLLGLLGREQFLAKYPGGQPPKPGEPVYQVGVYVSDPTPPTHGEVTVFVDVGRNYQPIGQRYRIETTWRFQSGPRACNATSNIEDGGASCTLNIGAAPAGVPVTIDVLVLLSDGVRLAVRTSFTPRDG